MLNKDTIIKTAISLLNKNGIHGLSTRKLASALKVEGPALYWHFKSKKELLAAMREVIILDVISSMKPSDCWQDWLYTSAHMMRKTLSKFRDSAHLLTIAPMSDRARNDLLPQFYIPLIEDGIPSDKAIESVAVLMSFVLGWVTYEQGEPVHELMQTMMNIDNSFDYGVRSLIAGFEKELT